MAAVRLVTMVRLASQIFELSRQRHQPMQDGLGPQELSIGTCRKAGNVLSCINVPRDSCLCGCANPVTDRDVIAHPNLSGQGNPIPQACTPRDRHRAHDEAVLSNLDVVRDMNEVVDLGAFADHGVAQRPSVDADVCPDLDIVCDPATPSMRNRVVPFRARNVAEPAFPNDAACLDDDSGPNPGPGAADDPGPQPGVVPDLDTGFECHSRPDPYPIPEANPTSNDAEGADGYTLTHRYVRLDVRHLVDSTSGGRWLGVKVGEKINKRAPRIFNDDSGRGTVGDVLKPWGYEYHPGLALPKDREVPGTAYERDMRAVGIVERRDSLEHHLPRADQAATDKVSDRLGRQANGHLGQF